MNKMYRVLLLTFLLLSSFPMAALAAVGFGGFDDEEPLPPDEAFALSTEVIDANTVRAEWIIADGYYLYRDKFKFSSATGEITTGEASYPMGEVKEDEFFGTVETYRNKVAINVPLKRTGSAQTLAFTVVSQGCADMGICYPPQTKNLNLALPAIIKAAAAEPAPAFEVESQDSFDPLGALRKLGSNLGLLNEEERFMTPEEAFILSVEATDGNTLHARWDIGDSIYMYRDKFVFELKDANGISLGTPILPEGKRKEDAIFGDQVVYYDSVDINIPLIRTNINPTEIMLTAKYQGCADAGFCYPPITTTLPVSLPAGLATNSTMSGDIPEQSEQDRLADSLASGNIIITILTFFGLGLLLTFTPCVLPMVPILSGIIAGQGENITTRRAFTMSLVYVLAMALTYTVAGVIAGLFGENLQATFQNPWILGTFAGVFVLLSLSMFGFYDLQMPSFLQSRLTEISNKQKGGTLIGVGVMGFLSALIVGPCVAAPLAGALIYIGQTGDAVLGGMALFALSMGMGAPLLLIGTSAGKILPKAGDWMNTIKAVFGVMLLAVAIWMLERIVPATIAMGLWAALIIVSGIYLGALEPVGKDANGWQKLWKGVGLIFLVYGILLLVGVASGSKDSLQPLHGIMGNNGGSFTASGEGGGARAGELEFKQVKGLAAVNREIATASAKGQAVMLDLYADWCISCKEMEKFTFSDAGVQRALSNVVLLQADVTLNDAEDKALMKRFGLFGPPSIMFFGPNGQERRAYRVVGFMNAEDFRSQVEKALN